MATYYVEAVLAQLRTNFDRRGFDGFKLEMPFKRLAQPGLGEASFRLQTASHTIANVLRACRGGEPEPVSAVIALSPNMRSKRFALQSN